MALLQSQLNQGQGVNQIQQQYDQQQRAAMSTQLGLQEQLGAQKNAAETGYLQNMIQADQQQLGMQETQTNQLLQLYEMALQSGGTADISSLASILGMDLDSLPQEQKDALLNAGQDPYGDIALRDAIDIDMVGLGFAGGAAVGTAIAPGPGTIIGAMGGGLLGLLGTGSEVRFNTPAGVSTYKNWDDALVGVQKQYSDKLKDYNTAGIKAVRKGQRIVFDYNGTKYNTANEALEAWRKYR